MALAGRWPSSPVSGRAERKSVRFRGALIGAGAKEGEAGLFRDGEHMRMDAPADSDGHSGPWRVVIADDHPLMRAAIREMLRGRPDLEVVGEVSDGRETVELCRRERPDLVLMDLWMPRMDGIEATREIKREAPTTIVLVLTAFEEPDYLLKALRAGASGYILKYATPQQLAGAISRVLKGEVPLNQEVAMQLLMRLIEENGHKEEEDTLPVLPVSLSPREFQVLGLLARGQSNHQIAGNLFISTSTVKNHVHNIIYKLGVSDRVQAAVMAIERGWISIA